MGYYELKHGVTGEAVCATIHNAISECKLDPTLLRGQAYDGASNMSGKYKGCVALIQKKVSESIIFSLLLPCAEPGCG